MTEEIKNIVVIPLYKLKSSSVHSGHRLDNVYEIYKEMTELSISSIKKNLVGYDEIMVLEGELVDTEDMFRDIFYRIYELWKTKKYNILCSYSDVLFMKQTEIFGKFADFMLFTTAVAHNTLHHLGHPAYLDGLKYYPSTMDEEIFKLADKKWKEAGINYKKWAFELDVHNIMFFTQKKGIYKTQYTLYPELFYQMVEPSSYGYSHQPIVNQGKITDAKVLHFHSTRGVHDVLNKMKIYSKQNL